MVEILQRAYVEKHRRRGRTPKLSIEDLLLATLEYLREYRTYAHIAASYGIAESNIYRGIKWVENTLSVPKKTKTVLCQKEKASYPENTDAGQSQRWTNHLSGFYQWEKARFQAVQRIPYKGIQRSIN